MARARGVASFDDDRRQCFTGRRFEGGFPTRVDLDDVEEGAEHAIDIRQPLGAGAGAGFVEGQRQSFGTRAREA